jgi:hypothetical protein
MESTTLEDAVDSLLAPSEETSEDNNFDAAVDAMIEPDDDQSEEVEVADEEQDDVEASSEDQGDDLDDVEIDDEDLVEAQAEDTNLIPVKVDGKEEMWTLDQLKQSAAGQSAINVRFQEAAEVRKQLEQQKPYCNSSSSKFLQLHQQAQNGGLQAQPRQHASCLKVTQSGTWKKSSSMTRVRHSTTKTYSKCNKCSSNKLSSRRRRTSRICKSRLKS